MDMSREKIIVASPSYLVFFDNIRVDHLVKNFSVDLSCDGSIGNASLEMIYVPDLYYSRNISSDGFVQYAEGIDNMTNCKIFVKNVFNNKYMMVFDGNIKSKSLSKSQGSYTLTFSASDYLTWLNKTVVALAIPMDDSLSAGDKLKWKAQGINPQDPSISQVTTLNDNNFLGQNLKDIITKVVNQTLVSNKIYTDANSVSVWDDAVHRIALMGDIDEGLRQKKVLDFVVSSNTVQVSSIYVMINDLIKNLLFEFYQDRDGMIRIKPPFWNERLLKDHIVDPSLIMSYVENVNWSNYYTRIVTTGGLEEWEQSYDQAAKAIVTPVVAYALDSGAGISTDYLDNTGGGVVLGNTSGWPSILKIGSTGDAVKQLQTILNNLGFNAGAVDSLFGQNTYKAVVAFQSSKGIAADGIVGPQTRAAIAGGNSASSKVGNDAFLKPTDIERKYGISVYEADQQLIKFSNSQLIDKTNSDAVSALKLYSKFMLSLLNSAVSVASMQTVAMPWIRPGFNLWVDPISIDKVFYVNAISHQGSSEGGVYTTFRLAMGRTSNDYCNNVNTFGALRENTSVQRDNVFVNQIYPEFEPEQFGETIWTPSHFAAVRSEFNLFYNSATDDIIYADDSRVKHFNLLYAPSSITTTATAIKAVVPTTTTTSTKNDKYGVDTWPAILRSGNSNNSVKQLQQFLTDHSFNTYGVDGIFGSHTLAALKNFQKSSGCKMVDGIVGTETKSIIRAKEGYSTTTTTVSTTTNIDSWPTILSKGSNGNAVSQLQKVLTDIGYNEVGGIDGIFGPNTQKAVKHFQSDYNLTSDGIVGPNTKAAMKNALTSMSSTSTNTKINALSAHGSSNNKILSDEYDVSELQNILNTLYSSAPQIIKDRSDNVKRIINNCENYIKTHYIKES